MIWPKSIFFEIFEKIGIFRKFWPKSRFFKKFTKIDILEILENFD